MCMSHLGGRSGIIHPNHGSPTFLHAAHELRVWTWPSLQDHQFQESCNLPCPGQGATRDQVDSPYPWSLQTKSMLCNSFPRKSQRSSQPPCSLQATSTSHTVSSIRHQLWEASCNRSDAFFPQLPLLPADGCLKSLSVLPKVGNKITWRT